MTISLVVISAVSGVYLSTSRNYTQDELLSRMQENARFALHTLAEDLSMASYWGPLITGDNINTTPRACTSTSTPECQGLFEDSSLSLDAANDCGPGTVGTTPWASALATPVEFMPQVDSGSTANTSFGCITASDFLAGSDILVVKRVEGQELASTRDDSGDAGDLFIRTDGKNAMLFSYAVDLDVSEGASISDWRYRANAYYIRNHSLKDPDDCSPEDGVPTLVRSRLTGNAIDPVTGENPCGEPQDIARGIEYFHVMFGVDTDDDATANIYTSSPTPAQMGNVTSARIYVLARSVSPDPNYENDKTYRLGDVTRTVDDNFYRRVFATTVTLRNQRNRIQVTGG